MKLNQKYLHEPTGKIVTLVRHQCRFAIALNEMGLNMYEVHDDSFNSMIVHKSEVKRYYGDLIERTK